MTVEQEEFFEELYSKYFNKIRLYAKSVIPNEERAHEVAQDTFHEAVRKIEEVIHHPNPPAWLYTAARNKARDCKRKYLRDLKRCIELNREMEEAIASPEASMDERLICGESPGVMERTQRALTPEEFRFLKQLTLEGRGHAEVAEELGITLWTSYKRLQRIREKLKGYFWEREEEE